LLTNYLSFSCSCFFRD